MAKKRSILLEADPVKIFRPTVRRWTVPTWGGGSGVCGTASASPRRALPSDPASR